MVTPNPTQRIWGQVTGREHTPEPQQTLALTLTGVLFVQKIHLGTKQAPFYRPYVALWTHFTFVFKIRSGLSRYNSQENLPFRGMQLSEFGARHVTITTVEIRDIFITPESSLTPFCRASPSSTSCPWRSLRQFLPLRFCPNFEETI